MHQDESLYSPTCLMFFTPAFMLMRYSTASAARRVTTVKTKAVRGAARRNIKPMRSAQTTIVIPMQKTVL